MCLVWLCPTYAHTDTRLLMITHRYLPMLWLRSWTALRTARHGSDTPVQLHGKHINHLSKQTRNAAVSTARMHHARNAFNTHNTSISHNIHGNALETLEKRTTDRKLTDTQLLKTATIAMLNSSTRKYRSPGHLSQMCSINSLHSN